MKKMVLWGISLFSIAHGWAGNPIVPDVGMADPHVYIVNDRAYLFTTRDEDPEATGFKMPDWNIWSSDDLVSWNHERTIDPSETYMGAGSKDCWATETAAKNGKYYFYFSNANRSTGVMVADDITGPYVDALGKPLLDKPMTPTHEYDPTILIEDDAEQSAYILFGLMMTEKNHSYHIAKLGEDMISLAEAPRPVEIVKDGGYYNDKPNLHKRNGVYYLSAGSHYGTSDSVYGPYTWVGNSGNNTYGLTGRAHGNYFTWKNQWFHTWCKFVTDPKVRYRDSCMSYLHYKDNGEMVTDTDYLDTHYATGVGQYDATWDLIQAEWYMAAAGVDKKEGPRGGFEIQNITAGGYLYFPNVEHMPANATIAFNVSSLKGGRIEVREDALDGPLLGTCTISSTGAWNSYEDVRCSLQNSPGKKSLCFVFRGAVDEDLFHLDTWRVILAQ